MDGVWKLAAHSLLFTSLTLGSVAFAEVSPASISVLPANEQKLKLSAPESGVIIRAFSDPCTIPNGAVGKSIWRSVVNRKIGDHEDERVQTMEVDFTVAGQTCALYFGRVLKPNQTDVAFNLLGDIHLVDDHLSVGYGSDDNHSLLRQLTLAFATSASTGTLARVNVDLVSVQ